MATILLLCHAHDLFHARHFLVAGLVPHWTEAGHRVIVHEGARDVPEADVTILHVDRTVIPAEYVEALRGRAVVVNGRAIDLSKRRVSTHLVGPYDDYDGPVIVKTDANAGGVPEWLHEQVARRKGEAPPGPPAKYMTERYRIFDSVRRVPPRARLSPDLVIERFVPERDPRGYATRHWIFLGDRGWCSRVVGGQPVLKGADVVERTMVDVPDAIRARREELGLDFGKLDFVIHDGEPILLDANRTPTVPERLSGELAAGLAGLARGIDVFCK
jgi:hypothetical protein